MSSDDPVLKESIVEFLKELKVYNMPVYVVITKSRRLDDDELDECKKLLQKTVGQIVGQDNVTVASVDSYGRVNVDELKDILIEIQGKTGEIFINKYSEQLRNASRYAEVYLMERIDKASLSSSRLEQEKEKRQKKIQEISVEIEREKNNFERQARVCINSIRDHVKTDLEASLPTISAMMENGNDITDKINSVVRRSVRIGINTEFEPKLKKYVKHISEMITIQFPDDDEIFKGVKEAIAQSVPEEVAKSALPVVLAGVGFALANPIVAAIGGIVGIAADTLHNIKNNRKKQLEIDKAANEIVAEVTKQTTDSIEREIIKYISKINQKIENDVLKQKAALEKSLEDINIDISIEENNRIAQTGNLEKDLEVIREFRKDRLS